MPVFTHSFALPFDPSEAIMLFTPKGEMHWVSGWAPRFIDPPGGETREGMVFLSQDETTVWTCLHWNPEGEARYLRIIERERAARVSVRCSPEDGGCRVWVTYDWVAFNEQGAAEIAKIDIDSFASFINGWRDAIMAVD